MTIETSRRDALALTGTFTAATALTLALPAGRAAAATVTAPLPTSGRDQPFDTGWRFRKGEGAGLEATTLDDSGWRAVDLPHDWSIEDVPGGVGPFDRTAIGKTATGFTTGGEGWYRKRFRLAGIAPDARVEILFDGIYCDSEIWLNGHSLGANVHGYIPVAVDLTPHLDRTGDNVLAVRVRNIGRNSRWYSGSGLYRQVTLDVLPPATRITRWGVGAWTRRLAKGRAEIAVSTQLDNADAALTLVTCLRDASGKVVAEASAPASATVEQTLSVRAPRLWSPESPALYSLETEVRRGATILDRLTQSYGIRIVTFDPHRGVAINGASTKLRGGCIHHDNGLLGACAYPDADDRRIRLLKARGFNAIRSSHNPTSRSLRDACDRIGMLLIDEAFDMWHVPKEKEDYSHQFPTDWERVVRAMVLSARNNPSVILWSIGNEIPSRSTAEGVEWSWKLANAVKRLDQSRPVTAGLNGVLGPVQKAGTDTARPGHAGKADNASTLFLDVPGYNYRIDDIEVEHGPHPERIVYASETFPRDVFDYKALMDRAPYFAGEFVWTAMDYLGEAGIGAAVNLKKGRPAFYMAGYPWVNAWCGDIDLIGEQKAQSYARDVAWGLSGLEIGVQRPVPDGMFENIALWGWSDELQSWTWPGSEGQAIAVRLYSSGDKVELRLNDAVIGSKTLTAKDKMTAEFTLPYAPGRLEAVAWKGGKQIGLRVLETVAAPAKLRLRPESTSGRKDRDALTYIPIAIVDAQGRLIPDDKRRITLTIDGPADLVAFGSANPQAVGSFQSKDAESFHGRAVAILRSQGTAGTVRITARSEGLESASAVVTLG
ncbi:DUF4982 domain-containing protein [Sphingobium sufflavum]|uniref:glycoside hydrolase family 2 TIM barrel-domain containing protein n=1 Tax=Sphingobium sufflavum TaxID=1129547 RepID=UPI001F4607F0|nr:glycoside hydrolase family 2 TIM barrel-domain containing protein [Sphingobium sufflavum]MCE7796320.1 DUF4982 domain-containing protein [Sphingobium sufflavum]